MVRHSRLLGTEAGSAPCHTGMLLRLFFLLLKPDTQSDGKQTTAQLWRLSL